MSSVADALRNELGVGSRLYPLADSGTSIPGVAEARSTIDSLASFIRETECLPRDEFLRTSSSVDTGHRLFNRIGCSSCHVETFVTMAPGTKLFAGTYILPDRLGNKIIHPYSDFLLHDVGTGDGIVQSADSMHEDKSTANKFRTAPLWGVRFRSWMLHDGKAVTYHQAISRHSGEAIDAAEQYERLSPVNKELLQAFLNSL